MFICPVRFLSVLLHRRSQDFYWRCPFRKSIIENLPPWGDFRRFDLARGVFGFEQSNTCIQLIVHPCTAGGGGGSTTHWLRQYIT